MPIPTHVLGELAKRFGHVDPTHRDRVEAFFTHLASSTDLELKRTVAIELMKRQDEPAPPPLDRTAPRSSRNQVILEGRVRPNHYAIVSARNGRHVYGLITGLTDHAITLRTLRIPKGQSFTVRPGKIPPRWYGTTTQIQRKIIKAIDMVTSRNMQLQLTQQALQVRSKRRTVAKKQLVS